MQSVISWWTATSAEERLDDRTTWTRDQTNHYGDIICAVPPRNRHDYGQRNKDEASDDDAVCVLYEILIGLLCIVRMGCPIVLSVTILRS